MGPLKFKGSGVIVPPAPPLVGPGSLDNMSCDRAYQTYCLDNPFGQLPVLMIDDKPLPQTFAIIRYLARELKLESENSILKANADMIVEALRSAFEKVPLFEKDEKKKVPVINIIDERVKKQKRNVSFYVVLTCGTIIF